MPKFYGKIGYAEISETRPGIWEEKIVERNHYGEEVRNTSRRLASSGNLNDNITIANDISIISDAYSDLHVHDMRYIEFQGAKWKIVNAEVRHPRIILTLGGVYNVQ